jgi:hypothetical protein
MPFYKVSRTDGCRYDEFDAVVVRAASEDEALKYATDGDEEHYGDDYTEWDPRFRGFERDGSNLKVEKLSARGPVGTVLASFNAG